LTQLVTLEQTEKSEQPYKIDKDRR